MSRDASNSAQRGRPAQFSVLLCRDCRCGTERKHPDFDHAAQEADLRAAVADAGGRVLRVNCLDACSYSNVVVVRSPRHGKMWFGGLADDATHQALMRFVRAEVNGDVPADLLPLRFVPSPNSQEVESRCAFRGIPVAGS